MALVPEEEKKQFMGGVRKEKNTIHNVTISITDSDSWGRMGFGHSWKNGLLSLR